MTADFEAVGQRPVRYAPRSITTLQPEQVRSWTVKRYAVSALRVAPTDEVHDVARRAVEVTLPESYPTGFAYAFSVVHEDEDGCYVVVAWWSRNRVILHTRTWLGDWADLSNLVEAPAGATACIWEMIALGHERDAWVRHVVRPLRPDVDAYLAASVSGWF